MLKEWHNNRYYGMRHGQSTANPLRKVVSWPEHGVNGFGLTELGKEQAHVSATAWNELMIENDLNWKENLVIVSSDFLRTNETAKIVAEVLGYQPEITFDIRLRERFFGEDEFKEKYPYEEVAHNDHENPDYTVRGIESANAIKNRVVRVMEDLDKQFNGKTILLVSHGDILQILQTIFAGINCGKHRDIPYIANAEIRALIYGKFI